MPLPGLQADATTKIAEIDARIDDLLLIRTTLVTAMEARCDDLMVCARTDNCPPVHRFSAALSWKW